ncbi:MAG: hypothetical protein IJJ42_05570 [Clostridia bacterium]|nr:hypothetical protein [Clostridia bacterium]
MKKLTAIAMAIMMVLMMICGAALAEEQTKAGLGVVGGWEVAEDPTITEEIQALTDKGVEGLLGVHYVPVAYLGSQMVAGRNHAVLCQATVVYPDAKPTLVILYLYEDPEGNVRLLNISDFDIGALCTYGAEE